MAEKPLKPPAQNPEQLDLTYDLTRRHMAGDITAKVAVQEIATLLPVESFQPRTAMPGNGRNNRGGFARRRNRDLPVRGRAALVADNSPSEAHLR